MPVMIRWFADGADPDYGLLAFRRISERLGNSPWFLRMLRDSSGAAESLTRVLSGSRYVGELMEWIPESAAWLDDDELLRPRSGVALQQEARAIQTRHDTIDDAMRSVRALRRRELLRTAMAAILGVITVEELADVAHDDHRGHDPGDSSRRASRDRPARRCRAGLLGHRDGAVRGRRARLRLGRRRHVRLPPQRRRSRSARSELAAADRDGSAPYSEDHRVPLDLDADLRPEGRNGPLARSLDSYAEYYRRWSLTWEAQALLRARGVAGSVKLIREFTALADEVRYPASVDPQAAARDQTHQGARRERASAAGRRPRAAPQARAGLAQRRRMARAAAAARARAPHPRHCAPPRRWRRSSGRGRRARPRGRRRSPRGVLAAGEPSAVGEHPAVRPDQRCAPGRPQAARRHRPAARISASLGDARSRRTTSPRPAAHAGCSSSSSTADRRARRPPSAQGRREGPGSPGALPCASELRRRSTARTRTGADAARSA